MTSLYLFSSSLKAEDSSFLKPIYFISFNAKHFAPADIAGFITEELFVCNNQKPFHKCCVYYLIENSPCIPIARVGINIKLFH